jgi:hypothetical protein
MNYLHTCFLSAGKSYGAARAAIHQARDSKFVLCNPERASWYAKHARRCMHQYIKFMREARSVQLSASLMTIKVQAPDLRGERWLDAP